MSGIARHLWLIPALPLLVGGVLALLPRTQRRWAAGLALGALAVSLALSGMALIETLGAPGNRWVQNVTWLRFGAEALRLGWVLDPLAAAMLVMISFVGLWIFIYSLGYMAGDDNFTRFFCFLSLFAGAMLGVVIANSLLLLFICWELVGLASYLLIGFWFRKPEAAAAATKAFVVTRIGDMALFLGMVWLYAEAGTLVFYDGGAGCLEPRAVQELAAGTLAGGLGLSTVIGCLVFVGAMGKSGQFPLHVWLPDAMEGPTPVSALIHAATMVAAGVFLVARMYPLMAAGWLDGVSPHQAGLDGVAPHQAGLDGVSPHQAGLDGVSPHQTGIEGGSPHQAGTLQVVTWVGAFTAVFAALIAVAQTDIKRILAYSTVSQLGYMFLGLGVGGVGIGMFHLLTHAFFKALLFLGAGSVIHGCHEEQDIRRMGGLRRAMPITFATYAIGMMALSGVPLFFSGFWSKDAILHAAHTWEVAQVPFYLGLFGAFLTAFYMTRQVCYVFFGEVRLRSSVASESASGVHPKGGGGPHESPWVMTLPLVVLAVAAVVIGFFGTPCWPWLQAYLEGQPVAFEWSRLWEEGVLGLMVMSSGVVFAGIGLGWWWYGRRGIASASAPDVLEVAQPRLFGWLRQRLYVDELYEATVVRWHAGWAALGDLLDRWVWGGLVLLVSLTSQGLAWASRFCDHYVVDLGFDAVCRRLQRGGRTLAGLTDGKLQNYLRGMGTAVVCLLVLLLWGGCR